MAFLQITRIQYQKLLLHKKPYILALITWILLRCFFQQLHRLSGELHAPVQMFEPFVSLFSSMLITLFPMVGLLYIFSDVPFLDSGYEYALTRTSKHSWILGQVFYIVTFCAIYYLLILALSIVICSPFSFTRNQWSEIGYLVSSTSLAYESSTEMSANVIWSMTPLTAVTHTYLLSWLYGCFVGLSLFALSLAANKLISYSLVLLQHVMSYAIAYLMDPQMKLFYASPHLLSILSNYGSDSVYGLNLLYGYPILIVFNLLMSAILLFVGRIKNDFVHIEEGN